MDILGTKAAEREKEVLSIIYEKAPISCADIFMLMDTNMIYSTLECVVWDLDCYGLIKWDKKEFGCRLTKKREKAI